MSGLIEKIKSIFSKGDDNPAINASQRAGGDRSHVLERERAPDIEVDPGGGGSRGFGGDKEPEKE